MNECENSSRLVVKLGLLNNNQTAFTNNKYHKGKYGKKCCEMHLYFNKTSNYFIIVLEAVNCISRLIVTLKLWLTKELLLMITRAVIDVMAIWPNHSCDNRSCTNVDNMVVVNSTVTLFSGRWLYNNDHEMCSEGLIPVNLGHLDSLKDIDLKIWAANQWKGQCSVFSSKSYT